MTKFKQSDSPTFSARVYPGEKKALVWLVEKLGLRSIADILHNIAAAEAIVMMISEDSAEAMLDTSRRITALLEKMDAADYDALEPALGGLAAALKNAAKVHAGSVDDVRGEA